MLLLTALGLGMICGLVAAAQTTIVPVSGTVGGAPELVAFTGNVHIRSTLVKDPDFGKPPTVQLAVDLVDIVGKGLTSGARYVSSAELHNSTELDAHEVIEMTFPFQPASSKGHLVARAGMMALPSQVRIAEFRESIKCTDPPRKRETLEG
jgi:hypothetical protein